jgi:flagellar FliJ protein
MKRFRFSLQRLLEVRRQQTLAARAAMQERLRDLRGAEARVAETEEEMRAVLAAVCERIAHEPTVADAVAAAGVLRGMQAALENQKAVRDEARGRADEAREEVCRRQQETRVVETLRERARARHKVDADRESANAADEIALTRLSQKAERSVDGGGAGSARRVTVSSNRTAE